MDVTVSAAPAANVSASYTNNRADQSQSTGGDFKSALTETSPDRNRGQSSADKNDNTKTGVTTSAAPSAQNDNAVSGGGGSTNAADQSTQAQGAAVADDPAQPKVDVSASLAKLVEAATQGMGGDATKGLAAVKNPLQGKEKLDDQQVQTALADVGKNASDATTAAGAKPGVKTPLHDKTRTDDPAAVTDGIAKDASGGAQDALSLLGQAAVPPVAALLSQVTNGGAADAVAQAGVAEKVGSDIPTKAKSDKAGKTPNALAQSATATPQAARNSAADALHMVSGVGHDSSGALDEKLAGPDSSSLKNQAGFQGVDVLDNRRIIAPISTSNGANIAATMTGDKEWSETMRSASARDVSTDHTLKADKTLNTLSIKMTPESLGTVTANLKLVDGQLTVSLVVENGSAYRKLHEDQGELMKSLKAQGFSIDQIQISIASPEKSSNDASQNNNQSQTNHQQNAQQNNSGFQQGSGRQQSQSGVEVFGQTSGGQVDDTMPSGGVSSGNSASGAGGQLYI